MANTENIEAWCKALESGEYPQTSGALKKGNRRYCCLGVACELSGLGLWNNYNEYVVGGAPAWGAYLPPPVRDWLGVETADVPLGAWTAAGMNDSGSDFAQIAAAIRDTYLR